jgi:hypothetical protein
MVRIAHLRKVMLNVVLCRGFIFCNVRSLQIRIIGLCDVRQSPSKSVPAQRTSRRERPSCLLKDARPTLVFLISTLRAPTPPRSPADIPSTSSMMRQVFESTLTPATVVLYMTERVSSESRAAH